MNLASQCQQGGRPYRGQYVRADRNGKVFHMCKIESFIFKCGRVPIGRNYLWVPGHFRLPEIARTKFMEQKQIYLKYIIDMRRIDESVIK